MLYKSELPTSNNNKKFSLTFINHPGIHSSLSKVTFFFILIFCTAIIVLEFLLAFMGSNVSYNPVMFNICSLDQMKAEIARMSSALTVLTESLIAFATRTFASHVRDFLI